MCYLFSPLISKKKKKINKKKLSPQRGTQEINRRNELTRQIKQTDECVWVWWGTAVVEEEGDCLAPPSGTEEYWQSMLLPICPLLLIQTGAPGHTCVFCAGRCYFCHLASVLVLNKSNKELPIQESKNHSSNTQLLFWGLGDIDIFTFWAWKRWYMKNSSTWLLGFSCCFCLCNNNKNDKNNDDNIPFLN